MRNEPIFDVIIIGGSYAGLSAAMALGRALRKVLIIDSGQPCNKMVHHAHNLLTRDGEPPAQIAAIARDQVLAYSTVQIHDGQAVSVVNQEAGFLIGTDSGETFRSKKLLLAAGVVDLMPDLPGFAACWGISIAHCPYCHGYEVNNTKLGVLGNGDLGFEFVKLIHNWTNELTLFTDGKSALSADQTQKLAAHNIAIAESGIETIMHEQGQIKGLVLQDGSTYPVTTLFARVPFKLSTTIAQDLGCEMTETGLIKTDAFQKTSIPGVFAAGDISSPMRSLSAAIASGTTAGALINHELIQEDF